MPKIVLNFANSRTSASNFKSFSRSLEQCFLTVGQNNFGNKIPFLLPPLLNTTFIPQFFHEIGVGQCIRLFKPLCQQRNSRDFSKFTHQCSFDGHHVLNMVEKICKKNCDFRAKLFMVYIRIAICYNNYSGLVKPKINGFKSFCSSLVL